MKVLVTNGQEEVLTPRRHFKLSATKALSLMAVMATADKGGSFMNENTGYTLHTSVEVFPALPIKLNEL